MGRVSTGGNSTKEQWMTMSEQAHLSCYTCRRWSLRPFEEHSTLTLDRRKVKWFVKAPLDFGYPRLSVATLCLTVYSCNSDKGLPNCIVCIRNSQACCYPAVHHKPGPKLGMNISSFAINEQVSLITNIRITFCETQKTPPCLALDRRLCRPPRRQPGTDHEQKWNTTTAGAIFLRHLAQCRGERVTYIKLRADDSTVLGIPSFPRDTIIYDFAHVATNLTEKRGCVQGSFTEQYDLHLSSTRIVWPDVVKVVGDDHRLSRYC